MEPDCFCLTLAAAINRFWKIHRPQTSPGSAMLLHRKTAQKASWSNFILWWEVNMHLPGSSARWLPLTCAPQEGAAACGKGMIFFFSFFFFYLSFLPHVPPDSFSLVRDNKRGKSWQKMWKVLATCLPSTDVLSRNADTAPCGQIWNIANSPRTAESLQ